MVKFPCLRQFLGKARVTPDYFVTALLSVNVPLFIDEILEKVLLQWLKESLYHNPVFNLLIIPLLSGSYRAKNVIIAGENCIMLIRGFYFGFPAFNKINVWMVKYLNNSYLWLARPNLFGCNLVNL